MSDIYVNMRNGMVASVLQRYGALITLSTQSTSSYNAATGVVTPGSEQSWTTFGIETEYDIKEIDGTLIRSNDKKFILLAADDFPEPTPDHKLTIGTIVWNIVRCNPVAPAGVAVVYEVQVRR